ncbi:hypothetical protein DFP73DRAFT_599052 [Morchella snyderi]|nr:hypothetical protein DFP73DRAFT_599052 [Morchella snyderi]
MQILWTFNRDYIFAMHGLNLLQIAWDGFSTSELVDNLEVLEPHPKRRLHRARRELANPQDDPAIRVGLIAPLGCFPKEEPVEKRLVKTPIDLTVVKSVNIPGSGKSLEFYIRRYFMRELRRDFDEIPEDINTWRVTTFRQLKVPVLLHGAGDERTVHTLHTIGTVDYRRGEARNDWVWFRQKPADLEPLQGLCLATLLAVFKLRDPGRREARLLAAICPLKPDFNGMPNAHHGLTRVSRYVNAFDDIWVVNIKSILGAAHLVPESTSPTNSRWFINTTIDLSTYGSIY